MSATDASCASGTVRTMTASMMADRKAACDQHGTEIAVRPVNARQKLADLGRMPQHRAQAGSEIRTPGGPGESDIASVEVNGAGRIPVDRHDAREVLQGKVFESGGQPWPRVLARSGQSRSLPCWAVRPPTGG